MGSADYDKALAAARGEKVWRGIKKECVKVGDRVRFSQIGGAPNLSGEIVSFGSSKGNVTLTLRFMSTGLIPFRAPVVKEQAFLLGYIFDFCLWGTEQDVVDRDPS